MVTMSVATTRTTQLPVMVLLLLSVTFVKGKAVEQNKCKPPIVLDNRTAVMYGPLVALGRFGAVEGIQRARFARKTQSFCF